MRFVRFHTLQDGVHIAVFDGGLMSLDGSPKESRLNEESLATRIANLKAQRLDTSVEEPVLVELQKRNSGGMLG